jgi:hypothetical protein
MIWEKSQAKRVCDACFCGDPFAMRKHADAYLSNGHAAVPELGVAFRNIVRQQPRGLWWERARQVLNAHLSGQQTDGDGEKPKREPPEWTTQAGGKKAWAAWVKQQTIRCYNRACEWSKKHPNAQVPRKAEWRDAIWSALHRCDGRAYYSRLPLSLHTDLRGPTANQRASESARWPSVDHVVNPATPEVVIETRVVNDMKTILDEGEFRKMIAHLAHVLSVVADRLPDNWCCVRSYGAPQQDDEPPLQK